MKLSFFRIDSCKSIRGRRKELYLYNQANLRHGVRRCLSDPIGCKMRKDTLFRGNTRDYLGLEATLLSGAAVMTNLAPFLSR